MLRRKMYDVLMDWKERGTKPLLIYGQRQIGKTFIIEKFAKDNFDTYIYAKLDDDGKFRSIFNQDDRTVDSLILSMSTLRRLQITDPKKTLIFLDEIQDCPNALASLKSFKKDGRYKIIASGSMLGVNINLGDEDKENTSVPPMGDARVIKMMSLDFEEFLWANDIPQEAIDLVRKRIRNHQKIEEPIYREFASLFRIFQITGGMPASVQAFVDNKTTFMNSSIQLDDIIAQIGRDITKYNDSLNATKTMECFQSIPYQLAETNKKFHYSRISPISVGPNNTRKAADRYMENLLWIKYAGYGNFCYSLKEIASPLKIKSKRDVFKVYLSDTGMLTNMYGETAINAIFTSNLSYNNGSMTENVVAESLTKCGFEPYYYVNTKKKNRMEIDFILEFFDGVVAIEVKSGKTRAAPSINAVNKVFDIKRRIMLENENIHETDDGIEHYPLFASAFFEVLNEVPSYLRK